MPISLIWKKGNGSPLLARFLAHVRQLAEEYAPPAARSLFASPFHPELLMAAPSPGAVYPPDNSLG